MVREASPLQGMVTWPMLTWQTEQDNAVNNSKSLGKSVRHWCSHSHTAEHPLLVWHPANNPELSHTNPNSVAFYSVASVWPQPLLFQHLIYSGHAGWEGHKSNWLLTLHSQRGKLQISNCAMLKRAGFKHTKPISCSFKSLLHFLLQKSHRINSVHMNFILLYRTYPKPQMSMSIWGSEKFCLLSKCFYDSVSVKITLIYIILEIFPHQTSATLIFD